MSAGFSDKRVFSALRFLQENPAKLHVLEGKKEVVLEHENGKKIPLSSGFFAWLIREKMVMQQKGFFSLTNRGKILISFEFLQKEKIQSQHQEVMIQSVDIEDETIFLSKNMNESPLSQLMRRKGKNGKPFLDQKEFYAGERLRNDYTKAQMMPRIGMNWQENRSSGKSCQREGISQMTDCVLEARMRVEKAIRYVGPELSGVLIDVCCFLKKMETVEIERQWPARSAKLVLKTALSVLARYYDPEKEKKQKVFFWGQEGYRPTLNG